MAEHRGEVVVIGAGPAGIAAAERAAAYGRSVIVLDDNPEVGGQIWRGERERLTRGDVRWILGARVVDVVGERALLVEGTGGGAERVVFEHLVLATGARERFLPFPGWTLPGVTGAGGLQAMVKGGLPIEGKRVVIAGSGPLLLAVAAYLRGRGARIAYIAEQAPWRRLAGFSLHLLCSVEKLRQALALRVALAGVPYAASTWPLAAEGEGNLERAVLRTSRGTVRIGCDYLACGFGLVPNLELARLLNCDVRDGFVAVDEHQRTSCAGIFAAGEVTGIGGLDLSLLEGEIAGCAAAGHESDAHRLVAQRPAARRFASALAEAFALRGELKALPDAQTIVCRCEDVTYERLAEHTTSRSAKLHTRCGMGPCQGRVCGAAAEFLFGWTSDYARPPVFPTRIATLTAYHEVTT
ncbi:NAD(P)/FAD-dependent oxidoreductase [bacterium]|nr:MAG: NAD(P)/FAD-dependent oxidoreductase [bacterium]